ncbi:AzlC family ABC transporter permease [Larsenimonas salina]|uniref:AzlC family ABC transporter permease n=1 Tax=Larsenimonas salina TaxID=1295565 RepID=UPI002072C7C6|nr:AzlC family ABC transporter permease [Larsenimonas salina]MCM5704584.1 AzlC family ABC transporter permease [Larsenimonas salina]
MTAPTSHPLTRGLMQATPIVAGYVPVAIAFGVIAGQAGLSPWLAATISVLVYSGAAQFLMIGLIGSGASPWFAALLALSVNLRHLVYGPAIAHYLPKSPWLIGLGHLLTDEAFALASARLGQHPPADRLGWLAGALITAWASWVSGTLIGALGGHWLTQKLPMIGEILPFALPALFVTLLLPRMQSTAWRLAVVASVVAGAVFALMGWPNAGIVLAALVGAAMFILCDWKGAA